LKPDFVSVTFGAGGSTREGSRQLLETLKNEKGLEVIAYFAGYGMVTFIRPRYAFCLGVAGYPEGHIEAPSKDKDIEYLKLKVDQGAEYIISNYFYDNRFFFEFLERCRAVGIDVPILPGVMPIYSVKMLEMLASLCGATITKEVRQGMAALPDGDKEALVDFGIEFATRQCAELLDAGVPGLHIYTMDRSKSAAGIVHRLRDEGLL